MTYTTQTLKVYVHHERDQVEGYTGNVLGGDERDDGKVSVDIRYINDSGRSRAFQKADSIDVDESHQGRLDLQQRAGRHERGRRGGRWAGRG